MSHDPSDLSHDPVAKNSPEWKNKQPLYVSFTIIIISLIWSITYKYTLYVSCRNVYHISFIYSPSYLWCSGAVVWCCGMRLSLCWGYLVWRCAVLCPAFQWLLSKHTQRWKPSLLAHTLWMKLCSCWRAAETQRAGAQWLVSFVYCALKYGMKYKTYQLGRYTDSCADHIAWRANWNFLIVSEVACKN